MLELVGVFYAFVCVILFALALSLSWSKIVRGGEHLIAFTPTYNVVIHNHVGYTAS